MSARPLLGLVLIVAMGSGCNARTGPGTLEAVIEPQGETAGFGNFSTGRDKSFGVFVCTRDGSVELESITPMHTEGDVEFLGARVYVSPDRYVGAAHGFPPDGIDESRIEPFAETVIESDCDAPPGDERVQLLVGAERTGSGGGVVDGFVVQTTGGELEIPFTILLCGDRMEYCEVLEPADGG